MAGSIMRGEGTAWSDIDFVVLYRALPAAYRESRLVGGIPVEMFVHDPATLGWFIDQDVMRGRPALLAMIAEGAIIGRKVAQARALQVKAAARLSAGPPPLTGEQRNALRYAITDALDDLRGKRSSAEMTAIGAMLYARLAELSLRGRRCWNGAGKWIPRLLEQADKMLAARYELAFSVLFSSGDPGAVLALGEAELALHGGPPFDGFRNDASPSARKDTRSPLAARSDRV